MLRWFQLLIITILLASCDHQKGQNYFPLDEKHHWRYVHRSGLQSRVTSLKIYRQMPVAGLKGWALIGPNGISRIAWDRQFLMVEQVPGTIFIPAIPMLDIRNPKSNRVWRGKISSEGRITASTATIEQLSEKYKIGVRSYTTLKVTVNLSLPQKQIELITWFSPHIGILGQQQRTNNYMDCSMEYLSGPEVREK